MLAIDVCKSWYFKANVLSEVMPKGDLLLPFLSYAINNNKSMNALNIYGKNIKVRIILLFDKNKSYFNN